MAEPEPRTSKAPAEWAAAQTIVSATKTLPTAAGARVVTRQQYLER